jgi:hypothetical protein
MFNLKFNHRRLFSSLLTATAVLAFSAGSMFASTTITGTVETTGRYFVSGSPVSTTTGAVLKISFENTTAGTVLELCAGTAEDFGAGTCPTRLSDSSGPGFVFLTIVDTPALSGKFIYVIRSVGAAASTFRLTIE